MILHALCFPNSIKCCMRRGAEGQEREKNIIIIDKKEEASGQSQPYSSHMLHLVRMLLDLIRDVPYVRPSA